MTWDCVGKCHFSHISYLIRLGHFVRRLDGTAGLRAAFRFELGSPFLFDVCKLHIPPLEFFSPLLHHHVRASQSFQTVKLLNLTPH